MGEIEYDKAKIPLELNISQLVAVIEALPVTHELNAYLKRKLSVLLAYYSLKHNKKGPEEHEIWCPVARLSNEGSDVFQCACKPYNNS